MGKLFEFQKINEFVVPCLVHRDIFFIETREPHTVSSKLFPNWCKGVVLHRPIHPLNKDIDELWCASDIVSHMAIDIEPSKHMKEAAIRAAGTVRKHGKEKYLKQIKDARMVLEEFDGNVKLGFHLLNSNGGD